MASVVIIGAGLTGISTAYHLEKMGFTDYLLCEREPQPGGLCRSVMQDGFTFDFTGHLLHIGNDYFRNLIQSVVGFDQFNTINRRSFIYSHDTYTRYPYQVNLYGLPPEVIVECIQGYINRPTHENPTDFRSWVLANFGSGFGKYFFFPYQGKIFAHDIDKLTASWTNKFVPSTSLEQILYGALRDQGDAAIGYNAQFFYPKQGGIFSWIKQFAHALKKPILTHKTVEKINVRNKEIMFDDGHIQSYGTLINTMPLDRFLACLDEPSDSFLAQARHQLKCNQVINFNMGINHANISDKHWIYFPEEKYPFYRIGFPHNFADSMAPHGCSSLYGEFAHCNKSDQWIENMLTTCRDHVKKLLGIHEHEIATEVVIPISHGYVIFDAWRDKNIAHIHAQLNNQSLYSIGRYGEWKYASMQDAVMDGKQMATTLMELNENNSRTRVTQQFSHELSSQ